MEKNNNSRKPCWESYGAIACIIIAGVILLLYSLAFRDFHYIPDLNIEIPVVVLIGLGIGFSISSIRHRGVANKIVGILCLVILIFLSLGWILEGIAFLFGK